MLGIQAVCSRKDGSKIECCGTRSVQELAENMCSKLFCQAVQAKVVYSQCSIATFKISELYTM